MPEILEKFMQLTKVDVAKRHIHGVFTAETPDKSGEVCDYATAKGAFEAWSQEISKVSKGKSKGNVRKMHGKEAVGKVIEIAFDDVNKVISGCVEVNEQTVQEAEKGILNGFSIGGSYVKKWACPVHKGMTRFTPAIAELSVVDNPCVPNAVFDAIKDAEFAVVGADGAEVMRKFAPKPPEQKELELSPAEKAVKDVEAALQKVDPEAEEKESEGEEEAEAKEEGAAEEAPPKKKKTMKLARDADGKLVKSVLEQVLEFAELEIEDLQKGDIPDAEEMKKAHDTALEKLASENAKMQAALAAIPAQIEAKFQKLTDRIKHLEAQPAPDTVRLRTFVKGGEAEKDETPEPEKPVYLGSHSPADFQRALNR